tara:strand:+ start:8331 stop:8573 length:243 start_codon:yes stop_codon:yes gene_type:complete
MRTDEQIEREVQLFNNLPSLLELSKKLYDILPENHKGRNEISKQVTKLRINLIKLDVICQDIQWGLLQKESRMKYRKEYH